MASVSKTRGGGASGTKKPQRRFQFIDNSDIGNTGTNSTQVRRHVMQEYMREKRWENRTKAEAGIMSSDSEGPTPPTLPTRKKVRSRDYSQLLSNNPKSRSRDISLQFDKSLPKQMMRQTKRHAPTSQPNSQQFPMPLFDANTMVEEIQRNDIPVAVPVLKRSQKGFYLTPQNFAQVADLLPTAPLTPPLSVSSVDSISPRAWSEDLSTAGTNVTSPMPSNPSSLLSAARTDPFDSLPMTLSTQDQELFDFYATVMPACSYGFERRSPHAHNWYLSVFIPEALKSPVAFQNTILVHAANTQAWVRGLAETPLAIEHRARASEMLSAHFQRFPLDTSDAAISSTLSAAALEDFDPRIERRQYAWLHWRAAVQKIRDRGGPTALEQNTSLRMLINWSDYIFSGYNGLGSTFFFDHTFSPHPESDAEFEAFGRREIAQQCEELIIFLKCAEHLASVAANLRTNSSARNDQPFRHSIFEPGHPLHTLLASSNGPRYTKTGQLKQIISRLAALMTINVALWEYRYSSSASEQFFQELVDNIYYNDLDQHTSVEALLQILLSGSRKPNLKHTERPWLVGRLLKVAKRLSRSSWERLNDFLLRCLTLESAEVPTMHLWEHALRNEILAAPLVNHVLPLMQAS